MVEKENKHITFALSFASDDDSKKMRTIIVGPLVKELSITILSFSVHLLHISDVLIVCNDEPICEDISKLVMESVEIQRTLRAKIC